MNVSLCVVAYNEEDTLVNLFDYILKQDYPHEKIEIVLVDSASTDKTKQKMFDFKESYGKEFCDVLILDNPKKILPCGWNVALSHFTSDVILRIDAHAIIEPDFVRKNMENIEAGEDITGGYRPNIIEGDSKSAAVLLLAESSMFGSSIASYRRNSEKTYTDSLFHAAYRRSVFQKVGGYNEYLARTEDNEMHYRMRKAGYKLCFDPAIVSYQQTRPTLKRMLRQKYANGYWIGLTAGVCPGCISIFHFVPFGFVLGILVTTALAMAGIPFLAYLMWGLYWILALIMAAVSVVGEKEKHKTFFSCTIFLLAFLFFLLHVSYGAGTLVGLLKMPFWRTSHKVCPRVNEIKELLNHEC